MRYTIGVKDGSLIPVKVWGALTPQDACGTLGATCFEPTQLFDTEQAAFAFIQRVGPPRSLSQKKLPAVSELPTSGATTESVGSVRLSQSRHIEVGIIDYGAKPHVQIKVITAGLQTTSSFVCLTAEQTDSLLGVLMAAVGQISR